MPAKYVEKAFLYLVALSVLLHLAIFGLLVLLAPEVTKKAQEPTMVDLTDLPEPPAPPGPRPVAKRIPQKPRRVSRETAPKGTQQTERLRQQPQGASLPRLAEVPPAPATPPSRNEPSLKELSSQNQPAREAPMARGEGLFRPRTAPAPGPASLFPRAGNLAHLEEGYRKKYDPEVEDGETKFLNSDDVRFGSFLRHFETAVYGVWNYPQAAAQRGIKGVTPVKITFNRGGEIVHVALLETSGSQILDDEVMRSLKLLGPIGSFPKGYTGETFKLIAFFQYGVGGGRLH